MAIYMWRDALVGIYHNTDLWLISLSSDGITRYTIADKNLWATTVWNSWDTLSEANCWKYYQRWNIWGFTWNWYDSMSRWQVNAQNYWPWNYFNNSTFRTSYMNWDSSNNTNLRWNTTNTNVARKWPCPSWYHIPTKDERWIIYSIWTALGGDSSDWTNFGISLKLPFAWYRSLNYVTSSQWAYCICWTSSPYNDGYNSYALKFGTSSINSEATTYRSEWHSIRPFKNEAVQPDDSWTVIYQ